MPLNFAPNQAAAEWGNRLIVLLIGGYQTHLSPRKGWKCAHRVLHGGESCSQWVKTEVARRGCLAAWPSIRARFAECKTAAQTLHSATSQDQSTQSSQESTSQPNRKSRRESRGHKCDWCDPCLPHDLPCSPTVFMRIGDAACDCGPADTGCIDCGSCACWP
ncbi:MAG TPA: membrane protein insertion efficiency factor YidD [Abditibacterium sp.]